MNAIHKIFPEYIFWFICFFKKVVDPRYWLIINFGILGAVRDFSNIVAFFIPLKLLIVLSNPSILTSTFGFAPVNLDSFIVMSVSLFFFLIVGSTICHIFLLTVVKRNSEMLWGHKNIEFPSSKMYLKFYQLIVETITHLIIIVVGVFCVIFFDKYLSVPLIVIIFSSFLASIWLANDSKRSLPDSPLKSPKVVFQLLAEIGFSLTLVLIVIEYYLNSDMDFLYTLLAVLISRIIFRNIQQLFIKHTRLFKDYYLPSK